MMLRRALLGLSDRGKVKSVLSRLPAGHRWIARFVAGENIEDLIIVVRQLAAAGRAVSIDHLGGEAANAAQADHQALCWVDLLARLQEQGLSRGTEVSVKLSALGQRLADGEQLALEHAYTICAAARHAEAGVMIEVEDHTTVDPALSVLVELRQEFPDTGVVLRAQLRRTEADCRDLARPGSRVRLESSSYPEPASVAFTDRFETDKSFVRCLRTLLAGPGSAVIASPDQRMITIAEELARRHQRSRHDHEFQLPYGIRTIEQQRLVNSGRAVRVGVPYGSDHYSYLLRLQGS